MKRNIKFYLNKHLEGISHFIDNISDEKTNELIEFLKQPHKNIFFTGVGKNGHVAAKASSTFNSMGIQITYLNPVDAVHGDIGCITEDDIILAITKSGETEELINFLFHASKRTKKIGLIHSNENNTCKNYCVFDLYVDLKSEADHLNKIPTVSIAIYTILLQSIACQLAKENNLTISDLVFNHPGGSIGKSKI